LQHSTKKAQAFRQLVADSRGYVQHLDHDAFEEAGTKVQTVLVVLHKARP
jgi:hypothetical protein